jgi:hypothetical protein
MYNHNEVLADRNRKAKGAAMKFRTRLATAFVVIAILAAGCQPAAPRPRVPAAAQATPTLDDSPGSSGLTAAQKATLASLQQVDDYPLFILHYQNDASRFFSALPQAGDSLAGLPGNPRSRWGCSLFAALGDPNGMIFGRNFDWEFSPAALVFTDPPDGYASVSMVDLAYLFEPEQIKNLAVLPEEEKAPLLYAPTIPFDGMNDQGVGVAMAAVPDTELPNDPAKKTLDSLMVMREILDHAATVDEAVGLIQAHNVVMTGGPALHYLIADKGGKAVLVEFVEGQVVVMPNFQPWHQATNFLVSVAIQQTAAHSVVGQCPRFDRLSENLANTQGKLKVSEGLALLDQVSQSITQWSAVYGLTSGEVTLKMGRTGATHTFKVHWEN